MYSSHVSEGNGNHGYWSGSHLSYSSLCPHQEFISVPCWAHIDIAGVMESHGEVPFLDKGMTGKVLEPFVGMS